jgi:putative redox protein
MKAFARHTTGVYTHRIEIRGHRLTADETPDVGGADEGPSPLELLAASVASCTAVTMEMYANRKGWDIGHLEVECEYTTPERGAATHFNLVLRLPDNCSQEQIEKLHVIAAKCPVHRILEGESTFGERIELVAPAQT